VQNTRFKGKFFSLIAVAVLAFSFATAAAGDLSPNLRRQLQTLADSESVGLVVVAFNTKTGLKESHLNVLRSVGVTGGTTFQNLGMVSQPMTAGQVRALSAHPEVQSIWSNDQLRYYMHQAKVMGGVERVQTTSAFHTRNGGLPVSGAGDFSVLVIDSGIDATHADLEFGTKVIQNVQTPVAAGTLPGFTPHVSIENVPNTDQTVGHGTHCAGILGGTGLRSGGLYSGVAPGAKIIGAGLGAGLFIINGLAAWEWGLANQYRYNIRVVSNSYGGNGPFNPNDPITKASLLAYERNMTVLFAAGNSSLRDTYNSFAKAPWVIGVAASSKEGDLAGFSSRGVPREERLTNEDPLDDHNAPDITAPGMGRAFESNAGKFTIDMVSTRSSVNLVANGLDADTELPLAHIPFYTQIHGTSMATPYAAGVVALMLDADITLTPDEIKGILQSTASRIPHRAEWEVGAGHINAYAAVDKVFNRTRAYKSMQDVTYNAVFDEERPERQNFHIDFNPAVSGEGSTNSTYFNVEPGMNVLDVFARVDTIAEEGTGNLVTLRIWSPSGVTYGGGAIPYPVIDTDARQVIVQNPEPGQWRLEVRGATGLTAVQGVSSPVQAAAPGPVDGYVTQVKFVLPHIPDLEGHPDREAIEAALKARVIDIYPDGTFKPDSVVTRADLATSLMQNTSLRQSVGAAPKFSDVSGDLAAIAEAVTAKGSTLRDFDFIPTGMMSFSGSLFNPAGNVNRLDVAVALVKALGHDAAARQPLATVTWEGTPLSDNAQIPAGLRRYVQIALDKGLFEAFPAEIRQIGPGQYQVIPGPRFEPSTTVKRSTLAIRLGIFRQLFTTGG
jgi:serine protease AprX